METSFHNTILKDILKSSFFRKMSSFFRKWLKPKINDDEADEFDELIRKALYKLCNSVLWGYASVFVIWLISASKQVEQSTGLPLSKYIPLELPLMTGSEKLVPILMLVFFNVLISAIGLQYAKKEAIDIKDKIKKINGKKSFLWFIGTSGIISIYFLTDLSGGFYWSPFTGYYSLIITTLSLCIGVFGGKRKAAKIRASIFVSFPLCLVIILSVLNSPIELISTHTVNLDNNLNHTQIKEISNLTNNFSKNDFNWNVKLNEHSIILTGILSRPKQRELIKAIKKINKNGDDFCELFEAIKNVGKQSRLFLKANQENYKFVFLVVMLVSLISSIMVLLFGNTKPQKLSTKHNCINNYNI